MGLAGRGGFAIGAERRGNVIRNNRAHFRGMLLDIRLAFVSMGIATRGDGQTESEYGDDDMHTVTKGPRDKSWLASVTVDETKLSKDIRERLMLHGLHQKIADAASGATNEAEAIAAMQKAADAILAGEWSSRGSGEGVDEFTRIARQIVRSAMKEALGAKSPEWATFTGYDDATQSEKLDANFAANESVFRPAVEARIEQLRKERDAKAKLAKAVSFNV